MFKNKAIFTSGFNFSESQLDLNSKFQMINIALLLSYISLVFGVLANTYKETYSLVPLELSIIVINAILFFILRRARKNFELVSFLVTIEYTFFFYC